MKDKATDKLPKFTKDDMWQCLTGMFAEYFIKKAIRILTTTPEQRRAIRLASLNGHIVKVL